MIAIKDIFKDIDWILLVLVLVLVTIGILFIFSSSIDSDGNLVSNEYLKQIVWALTGLVIMFLVSAFNYKKYREISSYLYWINLLLIILTLFLGKTVSGARAWIGISNLGIQPSEFMKISTLLFLSSYTVKRELNYNNIISILKLSAIILLPVGIILLQPDLGTAMVFLPVFLMTIYVSGAPIRYVLFIFFFLLSLFFWIITPWLADLMWSSDFLDLLFSSNVTIIIIIAVFFIIFILFIAYYFTKLRVFYWSNYIMLAFFLPFGLSFFAREVLQDYQIMRLIVFIDPSIDSQGAGWNIIQSLTAIGSGNFWGKGFLQGTQSHLRYLPQQSTDFIFSIIAEEWGFVGGLFVFILYFLLILRIVYVAIQINDFFPKLIASGIASIFMFHFIINVGMTMGIMPITGIPLLLLSYGGSSLWMSMASIGIVINIYKNRYTIN